MQISEYNINNDFKNEEHIELLKKQIQIGVKLDITCFQNTNGLEIIDGGHTFTAYKELGLDPLKEANIRTLEFESDADKLAFSRHRNRNRLQQEPTRYTRSLFQELQLRLNANADETKKILRRYYNLKTYPDKYVSNGNDNHNIMIINSIFEQEPIAPNSFINNNLKYLDFPDWLADQVDHGKLSPNQAALIDTKIKDDELKQKIASICEDQSLDFTKNYIKEILKFKPEIQNFWFFNDCPKVFGDPNFPGRCNGNLVRNVLHYWTEKGDLVVDPMAGGGTTGDICRLMDRKCLQYDIKPSKPEIIQNDITQGLPEESQNCDLIFLDPPYYKKKEKEYEFEPFTESLETYLDCIKKIAEVTYETLKPQGVAALLISDYFNYKDPTILLSEDHWKIFRETGFIDVMKIACPYPLAALKATWPDQEENPHKLADVSRFLYIFRKLGGI